MMRERLIPLALATTVLLVASSCTSTEDNSDSSSPETTTNDTQSTEPTRPTQPTGTTTPVPTSSTPGPQGLTTANLEFFGDCDALLTYMQTEAESRVTAWGLGGGGFFAGDGRMMEGDLAATDEAGAGIPETAPASDGGVQGQDYSGTNTQEVASMKVTSSRPTAPTCTWPATMACVSCRSPTPRWSRSRNFRRGPTSCCSTTIA